MKMCPVCRARTFDDAEVCYGCLHRFADEKMPGGEAASEAEWEPDDAVRRSFEAHLADGAKKTEPHTGKHAQLREEERRRGEALPAAKLVEPDAALRRSKITRRSDAVSRRATSAQVASPVAPFDQAGWVVRFELPGSPEHAALVKTGASASHGSAEQSFQLDSMNELASPCSLVVSICPARGSELWDGSPPEGRSRDDMPKAVALEGGRIAYGNAPLESRGMPAAQASQATLVGEGGWR